jgi:uncharacterized protein YmfQ (DUF2313 family)
MPDATLVASARTQLLALLPGGKWMKHPGTVTYKLFSALAVEFARAAERTVDLRAESIPGRPVEMIGEWESDLGLPDPSLPAPSTLEQRQALVESKLLENRGHSQADVEAIALSLGYDHLTFTRYYPFEYGVSEFGEPLNNDYWAHVVTITLRYGDLDEAVQAAIQRVRRAHADFFFEFVTPPDFLLLDGVQLTLDGEEFLA